MNNDSSSTASHFDRDELSVAEVLAYINSDEYAALMRENDERFGVPSGPSDMLDSESESEYADRVHGSHVACMPEGCVVR